jgi:hypothetical protein
LRGTELITHCGHAIPQMLDERSEVTLVPPPLAISNVNAWLIVHRQMANDPGTKWLRGVIVGIYNESRNKRGQGSMT